MIPNDKLRVALTLSKDKLKKFKIKAIQTNKTLSEFMDDAASEYLGKIVQSKEYKK